ncbi:MAG TPA: VOC family protein [Polyangiales bacterium]|nr:VOC family protein [Polyangiales bacterium]
MFKKVAFTMFAVEDSARARAFYEDKLGLERGSSDKAGVWTEYDLPGGGCLALFKHPDPAHVAEPGSGSASIALEVESLDSAMKELKAKGVTFSSDVIQSPVCRMAHIKDSEGNSIMLHELHEK